MQTLTRLLMATAIAATISGCAPPTAGTTAIIEDKNYVVAPDHFKITAGILQGEVTGVTVLERVEQGSGRVDTPAKLKGTLVLTNSSTDQSVRLLNGMLMFIDDKGQPIKVEASRTNPMISFSSTYNAPDRLDPGKEITQDIYVNFPAEALNGTKLAEIRLEIEYMPAAYRKDTVSLAATVNGK